MTTKSSFCVLLAMTLSASVHARVFTFSDKGLMSLDWSDSKESAKVVAIRDLPGPGVEFDIRYPSTKHPGSNIHYLSCKESSSKLPDFDLTAHDSFGLSFTLVAVDGVTVPPVGGNLVVGAIIYHSSTNYRYRPEVVNLMASGKNKNSSITDLSEDGVWGLGFETHFLGDGTGWKDGATLTLLVEPMPGAIQLPEQYVKKPAPGASKGCGNSSSCALDAKANTSGAGGSAPAGTSYREWLIGMALSSGRSAADAVREADEVLKQLGGASRTDRTATPPPSNDAGGKPLHLQLGGGVALKLTFIPAGEFLMGAPVSEKDRGLKEGPQHSVRISKPFYIGRYEVLQAQWEQVMGNNPSHFKGLNLPVEQVSWEDCQLFCAKLSKMTAKTVRLPTEAEWEYACRAGITTRFNGGDNELELRDYAWMDDNSEGTTHPGGTKQPNRWGLYDMHGNVWEWCADWYGENYDADSPSTDPSGPADGLFRVVRGGSWHDLERMYLRCAYRLQHSPRQRNQYYGFRVVVNSDSESAASVTVKPQEPTVRPEPSGPRESSDRISETIMIYDNAPIPANMGISTGRYTKVDGYRYANIAVEYEQKAADEAPLSLGIAFAHDANGKMGSSRYFAFDENFTGAADTQMMTLSGKNSWSGNPHNVSRYTARLPIMGPFLQVFPFNHHSETRKFSVVIYLTK